MKVLITGFGPFFGHSENPSKKLLEELSQMNCVVDLSLKLLSVEFESNRRELEELNLAQYDVILFFGVAGSRNKITVEKLALNIMYSPNRPDNAGKSYEVAEAIDDSAPLLLESTFACEELNQFLNQQGLESELSFHAGTYVCNSTLYNGLSLTNKKNTCSFIHLPKNVNTKRLARALVDYLRQSLR